MYNPFEWGGLLKVAGQIKCVRTYVGGETTRIYLQEDNAQCHSYEDFQQPQARRAELSRQAHFKSS